MRFEPLFLVLILLSTTGCPPTHSNYLKQPDLTRQPPSAVPPAPVTADQVHSKNAHSLATAMFDELEWDDHQVAKETKNNP
jgi:hypothetical protein